MSGGDGRISDIEYSTRRAKNYLAISLPNGKDIGGSFELRGDSEIREDDLAKNVARWLDRQVTIV